MSGGKEEKELESSDEGEGEKERESEIAEQGLASSFLGHDKHHWLAGIIGKINITLADKHLGKINTTLADKHLGKINTTLADKHLRQDKHH